LTIRNPSALANRDLVNKAITFWDGRQVYVVRSADVVELKQKQTSTIDTVKD